MENIEEIRVRNETRLSNISEYTATLDDNLSEVKNEYALYIKKCLQQKYHIGDLKKNKTILILGGAGYFGSFLFAEFMRNTDYKIILLSRTINHIKIRNAWVQITGNDDLDLYQKRIELIAADITAGRFGLSESMYNHLLKETDIIINSAVNRSISGVYEDFEKINIAALDIINQFIQKSEKEVELYHISTVGVSEGEDIGKQYSLLTERDIQYTRNYDKVAVNKYYYQSKYEAEQKLIHSGNGKITILRLGNILFSAKTGTYVVNGQLCSFMALLKAMLHLKGMPSDEEKVLDFTFADETARAVRKIVQCESNDSQIRVFHLFHNDYRSFAEIGNMFSKFTDIELVDYKDIYSYLIDKYNDETKEDIELICKCYLEGRGCHTTKTIVTNDATKRFLSKLGFRWTSLEQCHIEKLFSKMNS